MNALSLTGILSFTSQAAGSPVTSVMNPMTRNVHAGPSLRSRPSIAKLLTAPPSPPDAKTMPLARPRRREKYCAGVADTTLSFVSVCLNQVAHLVELSGETDKKRHRRPKTHHNASRNEKPAHIPSRKTTEQLPSCQTSDAQQCGIPCSE